MDWIIENINLDDASVINVDTNDKKQESHMFFKMVIKLVQYNKFPYNKQPNAVFQPIFNLNSPFPSAKYGGNI